MEFTASAKSARHGNDWLQHITDLSVDGAAVGSLAEQHVFVANEHRGDWKYAVVTDCGITFQHRTEISQSSDGCTGYTTITAIRGDENVTVTVHHF